MATTKQAFLLRLPEELDSQIKAQAHHLGISKHQFIIDAIITQLGTQPETQVNHTVTLEELQAQLEKLQGQFKILADHCGNPLGTK